MQACSQLGFAAHRISREAGEPRTIGRGLPATADLLMVALRAGILGRESATKPAPLTYPDNLTWAGALSSGTAWVALLGGCLMLATGVLSGAFYTGVGVLADLTVTAPAGLALVLAGVGWLLQERRANWIKAERAREQHHLMALRRLHYLLAR